jgi:hypothetical protein
MSRLMRLVLQPVAEALETIRNIKVVSVSLLRSRQLWRFWAVLHDVVIPSLRHRKQVHPVKHLARPVVGHQPLFREGAAIGKIGAFGAGAKVVPVPSPAPVLVKSERVLKYVQFAVHRCPLQVEAGA